MRHDNKVFIPVLKQEFGSRFRAIGEVRRCDGILRFRDFLLVKKMTLRNEKICQDKLHVLVSLMSQVTARLLSKHSDQNRTEQVRQ